MAVPNATLSAEDRQRQLRRRRAAQVTIAFAAVIIPVSAYGFICKFIELVHTLSTGSDGMFAVTPIVNYLLSSVGFFLLLGWAIYNGMFSDLESPKDEMLRRERELDRWN